MSDMKNISESVKRCLSHHRRLNQNIAALEHVMDDDFFSNPHRQWIYHRQQQQQQQQQQQRQRCEECGEQDSNVAQFRFTLPSQSLAEAKHWQLPPCRMPFAMDGHSVSEHTLHTAIENNLKMKKAIQSLIKSEEKSIHDLKLLSKSVTQLNNPIYHSRCRLPLAAAPTPAPSPTRCPGSPRISQGRNYSWGL
ncbi:uncharacterized protein LOC6641123 [Drosophila willistoni]|uniref:uncharacterized protein LOC6641123 n=1 Tax=Drosophila willistoni TaxID=7260 RepID=UPI000C26C696|nr:uncharacterized protein LOC6641123 [Drosophila willistoni]